MNAIRKYDILKNHKDYEIEISSSNNEGIRVNSLGLGNNIKGLPLMSHKRNLSNYAEELVAYYAKYESGQYELSLLDLPKSEQNELARLYIEATDREINECVLGNDFSIDNDYTCALLSMLQEDSQENRERFAEVTSKNIIIYYTKSLQGVLDEACHTYLCNVMNEQGYYAHRDVEHGDVMWSKF